MTFAFLILWVFLTRSWNYYPEYPLRQLEKAKPGQVIHVSFHVKNAFNYWQNWDESYGESPLKRVNPISFFYKASILKFRFKLLRGYSFKRAILKVGFKILTIFLAKGIGFFWPKPQNPERDTSWETGRKRIYDLGIRHWHNHLKTLGMIVPGGKVLEVGSGNGQWLIAYAQDAAEVIGIEPSTPICEFSIKKYKNIQTQKVKLKLSVVQQNIFHFITTILTACFVQKFSCLLVRSSPLKR